jgi:hypothetical protein
VVVVKDKGAVNLLRVAVVDKPAAAAHHVPELAPNRQLVQVAVVYLHPRNTVRAVAVGKRNKS